MRYRIKIVNKEVMILQTGRLRFGLFDGILISIYKYYTNKMYIVMLYNSFNIFRAINNERRSILKFLIVILLRLYIIVIVLHLIRPYLLSEDKC